MTIFIYKYIFLYINIYFNTIKAILLYFIYCIKKMSLN